MARTDGVLRACYEVHCLGCERAALGLSTKKAEAAELLRQQDWHRVGGKWFCWKCFETNSPDRLRTMAMEPSP